MATIKRSAPNLKQTEAKTSLIKRRVDVDAALDIKLPTKPTEPENEIGAYTFLIYGSKKIGKTSLAAQFPKALAFMFEPGGKSLRMFQQPCPSWSHFKQTVALLASGHAYATFIVDTAGLAYDRCLDYVCKKADIEHPGDEGFGKGWNRVKQELGQQFSHLLLDGAGFLALAHDKIEEIETKSGRKFNKIMPNLSGQAEGYFAATMDVIGYYHIDDNQRWLQIREDDYAVAGCRCEENFLTPEGQQVFKIPMGNSPEEAYNNLIKAFNNKQTETYAPNGIAKRIVPANVQAALKSSTAKPGTTRPSVVAIKKTVSKR